jgi:hypothetical protein
MFRVPLRLKIMSNYFLKWKLIVSFCAFGNRQCTMYVLFNHDAYRLRWNIKSSLYPLGDCNGISVIVAACANRLVLDQSPRDSASDQAPSCLALKLYLLYMNRFAERLGVWSSSKLFGTQIVLIIYERRCAISNHKDF